MSDADTARPEELLVNDLTPPEAGDAAAQELVGLRAELEQANGRALRAQAELENFRKRSRREVDEQLRYASLPVISDLLPALDNLDRAVAAAEGHDNSASLLEGVKMVAAQLMAILDKHHCRPIEAVGSPFDPHLHEALAQEPSAELPAGYVTRLARAGYKLHDRVIRPAQVLVSTGPTKSASN